MGQCPQGQSLRLLFGVSQQSGRARHEMQTSPRTSSRPSWVGLWEAAQKSILQRPVPRSCQGYSATPLDTSIPAPPSLVLSHPSRILRHILGLVFCLPLSYQVGSIERHPQRLQSQPIAPRKVFSTASFQINHIQH